MFRRPIMLLLSVAIPAATLAAAPEDPSPTGGQLPSGTAWELTSERDLLYRASIFR